MKRSRYHECMASEVLHLQRLVRAHSSVPAHVYDTSFPSLPQCHIASMTTDKLESFNKHAFQLSAQLSHRSQHTSRRVHTFTLHSNHESATGMREQHNSLRTRRDRGQSQLQSFPRPRVRRPRIFPSIFPAVRWDILAAHSHTCEVRSDIRFRICMTEE